MRPIGHATYRLLVPVPLTVCFPSIVYRIEWAILPHERRLMLCRLGCLGGYMLASFPSKCDRSLYDGRYAEHTPEEIERFALEPLTVPRPGVPDMVFMRLVREGRAIDFPPC